MAADLPHGRPLPVDPNPSWNGYSTGLEKIRLVLQTIGFKGRPVARCQRQSSDQRRQETERSRVRIR